MKIYCSSPGERSWRWRAAAQDWPVVHLHVLHSSSTQHRRVQSCSSGQYSSCMIDTVWMSLDGRESTLIQPSKYQPGTFPQQTCVINNNMLVELGHLNGLQPSLMLLITSVMCCYDKLNLVLTLHRLPFVFLVCSSSQSLVNNLYNNESEPETAQTSSITYKTWFARAKI